MRRFILCLTIGFVVFGFSSSVFAATTQVDALIEKLVEKGILNRQEAIKLKAEVAEDEKIVREEGLKQSLPSWVRDTKLKGDLRVRFQSERREGTTIGGGGHTAERNRGRIRARLGLETKVNEQAKVHFGLATGGTDPRSTNQSFENTFELKDIRLDYAYAEYSPFSWATFFGGRMKNPIWEPTDLLWDTDINPEGGAGKLKFKLANPNLEPYFNTAVYVLDEDSKGSDPWMYVFQPGLNYKINDNTKLNLATAYYGFKQVEGAKLDHSSSSNTSVPGRSGFKKYNFNSLNPAVELAFKKPFEPLGIEFLNLPYLSLFGEYIHNLSTNNSNTGYTGGFRIGHEKVSNWGHWQARYFYIMLGTDAWLDNFPDSDRYGGRTGVRSHEILLTYGLNKNVNLELDYYRSNLTSTRKIENLIQADLNFKF
jgi:polyhydroxyalkanoate synthesis regulator phasin